MKVLYSKDESSLKENYNKTNLNSCVTAEWRIYFNIKWHNP